MAKTPKRIKVGSDLALALREAERDGTAVELEANGATYPVLTATSRRASADMWAGYDAALVQNVVKRYAGTLGAAEAERIIANLYRAREAGTRPADRP